MAFPFRLIASDASAPRGPETRSWSGGDLSECLRCAEMLRRHGLPVEIERGETDEGDPWLVFVTPEREEPLLHAARIDGLVVLACAPLGVTLKGFTLREALRRLFEDERFTRAVAPVRALGGDRGLHAHPLAILFALVVASFALATGEAEAAPALQPRPGGTPGEEAAAGEPVSRKTGVFHPVPADLGRLVDELRRPARLEPEAIAVAGALFALLGGAGSGQAARLFGDAAPEPASRAADAAPVPRADSLADTWSWEAGPRQRPVDAATPSAIGVVDTGDGVAMAASRRDLDAPIDGLDGWATMSAPVAGEPLALALAAPPEASGPGAIVETPSDARDGAGRLRPPLPAPAPEAPLLADEVAAMVDRMLREALSGTSGARPAQGEGGTASVPVDGVVPGPGADAGAGSSSLIDLRAHGSHTDLMAALKAFVAWLSDGRNAVALTDREQAWVPLLIAASFPKDGVTRLLVVDDGPATIMPYRLTHDIGIISQDFVFLDGSPHSAGERIDLVGVGQFDALSVIGWIAA